MKVGPQLSVQDLHFTYGKRAVLQGLNMQPRPGQLTALLGANGAGKSTLFLCLAGLLKPSAGAITLGEQDLSRMPITERLRRICYIPQSYAVNARLTVYETVLLAQEQSGQHFESRQDAMRQVEQTLEVTGLTELSGVYLTELSGGQQQRVGTAQALSQSPQVLLMDEPTSALDLRYQLETLELLRRFTQERQITTIVALHDLNLAVRYADWLLLLVDGQFQTQGNASDMVSRPELGAVYGVELELAQTATGIPLVAAHLLSKSDRLLPH